MKSNRSRLKGLPCINNEKWNGNEMNEREQQSCVFTKLLKFTDWLLRLIFNSLKYPQIVTLCPFITKKEMSCTTVPFITPSPPQFNDLQNLQTSMQGEYFTSSDVADHVVSRYAQASPSWSNGSSYYYVDVWVFRYWSIRFSLVFRIFLDYYRMLQSLT